MSNEIDTTIPEQEPSREQLCAQGKCPSCGTQLYRVKTPKKWSNKLRINKKKKQPVQKPLTVEGKVLRGQCLQCLSQNHAESSNGQEVVAVLRAEVLAVESHQAAVHEEQDEEQEESDSSHEDDEEEEAESYSSEESFGSQEEDEVVSQEGQDEYTGTHGTLKASNGEGDTAVVKSEGTTNTEVKKCHAKVGGTVTDDEETADEDMAEDTLDSSDCEKKKASKDAATKGTKSATNEDETQSLPSVHDDAAAQDEQACVSDEEINIDTDDSESPGDDDHDIHEEAAAPLPPPQSSPVVMALQIHEKDPNWTAAPPTVAAIPIHAAPPQPDGGNTTYKGEFNSFGNRHGEGELVWSNGDRYVGTFWNGVREGHGTLYFANGCEYVGQWENNKMNGEGTQRFPNGDVYTGQYVDGKRSGQGRCYFANGDLYKGSWHQDHRNGHGLYYYNHGQVYDGMFCNDARHGLGKYQLGNGKMDVHRFVNDERVGEGVRWSASRKKAWRLVNGKVKGRVSLERAQEIARRIKEDS